MYFRAVQVDALIRELRSHVRWPPLAAGERIDVTVRVAETVDAWELHAWRWNEANPRQTSRHALQLVTLRPWMLRGSKSAIVEEFMGALQTLAVVLSGAPPKGWRLYSRAKVAKRYASRLRTKI